MKQSTRAEMLKRDRAFLDRIARANGVTPDQVRGYLRDLGAGRVPRLAVDLLAGIGPDGDPDQDPDLAQEFTADDCMEFYRGVSGWIQYNIRREARAAGLTIVRYLRRELPSLIAEGMKSGGRVAA